MQGLRFRVQGAGCRGGGPGGQQGAGFRVQGRPGGAGGKVQGPRFRHRRERGALGFRGLAVIHLAMHM